jgi:histone-lysine N-methyltransferase SETMAR
MECQVEKNEHFRHHQLYGFNRGSKAAEAARNNFAVYGEDSIAERTVKKWFARFKQGTFDMSDTPRSGRPCCASGET